MQSWELTGHALSFLACVFWPIPMAWNVLSFYSQSRWSPKRSKLQTELCFSSWRQDLALTSRGDIPWFSSLRPPHLSPHVSISQHALWWEFLGANLPWPYPLARPQIVERIFFLKLRLCSKLVLRWLVVEDKRNFCWCWLTFVVGSGVFRVLIIV